MTPVQDWMRLRENVRRAVKELEMCWRCQRISECQKYVLGNMVMVWLCKGCRTELAQPQSLRRKALSKPVPQP